MQNRIYNNDNTKFKIKVNLYQSIIIFAKNCTMTIKDINKDSDCVFINKGEMFFLERNLKLSIEINKKEKNKPYDVLAISNEKLKHIFKVYSQFGKISISKQKRELKDKILLLSDDSNNTIRDVFHRIKSNGENERCVWEFSYLLSRAVSIEKLYASLCVSASLSFTDKVRKLIESNLSQTWRLSTVAEELNMSEICVRKKLEIENINFNQVLLDARMQAAVKLILNGEYHINKVSSLLGMSSVSYFIKIFSSYYGVTPKQFYLYHKADKDLS